MAEPLLTPAKLWTWDAELPALETVGEIGQVWWLGTPVPNGADETVLALS